ncbi:pentapeptide repeat-containing protein [Thiotrichales bacterium 19S3-7]|nr:pentapeptide repeat-containing protein [Thiotrichales bacterium 19S3-7]MCF6802147.1 pentapeptide repeat-containing protein [Thiotrichales bacterium 19S3-11]
MKQIKPEAIYLMRKVTWDKPQFTLHTSVYAGFNYDINAKETNDAWLDQKTLQKLIQKLKSSVYFDHGIQRAYSECFVYTEDKNIKKINLQIADIDLTETRENFLSLPLTDKHYRRSKGTFNDQWLKERWPALPIDCHKDVYQIAPKNLQSQTPLQWHEPFKLTTYDQLGNKTSEITTTLPNRCIKLFYLTKDDQFKQLELKPDLLWLLPEQKVGIIIAHAQLQVSDQVPTNIKYIYITDPTLDQNLSIDEHKAAFEKKIAAKKPNFKPKPMPLNKPKSLIKEAEKPKAKTIEMDPEVAKIKAEIDQKLAELKSQYPTQFNQAEQKTIPQALQNALDEKDPKLMSDKLTDYVTSQLSSAQTTPQTTFSLTPPKMAIDAILLSLAQSLEKSLSKAKLMLPKSQAEQLPEPKSMIDTIAKHLKTDNEEPQKIPTMTTKKAINFRDGDFSNKNLASYDFSHCDLTNTNFEGADLSGAIFDQTIINNTNFNLSNLTASRFNDLHIKKSTFNQSIFKKSQLSKVSINHSEFDKTNLSDSLITKSFFKGCPLNHVRLNQSTLKEVTFDQCQLHQCYFTQAVFDNVRFNHAKLSTCYFDQIQALKLSMNETTIDCLYAQESQFKQLTLDHACLNQSSFEQVKAEAFRIKHSQIKESNFSSSHLEGIRINDHTTIAQCNFNGANLTKARLLKSTFERNQFDQINLDSAMIYQCIVTAHHFNRISAKGANFYGSDLSNSVFDQSNLLNAKLRASNLNNTSFSASNLYNISLYQASICNSLFDNNLTKENFELTKLIQVQEA